MFVEDIDDFFDVDEHGDSATVGGETIVGIFSNDFVEFEGMDGTQPVFRIKADDLAKVDEDDALTITSGYGAGTYVVEVKGPAEMGTARLVLRAT